VPGVGTTSSTRNVLVPEAESPAVNVNEKALLICVSAMGSTEVNSGKVPGDDSPFVCVLKVPKPATSVSN